ncbi:MAG: GNAT family N-acetyltransferase, partial [Mycobacterium sp.]
IEPPLRVGSAGVPLPELCIAVVPDMRGSGVGGALLDALFVQCAGTQTALCLNVHVRNPARKLYQRKGFEEIGQGRGPLGMAMQKDL